MTSAEDHHGLNRGVVWLTDVGDKTFRRSAGVNDDGSLIVKFVPSGTYTMTVENASDTVPEEAEGLVNRSGHWRQDRAQL